MNYLIPDWVIITIIIGFVLAIIYLINDRIDNKKAIRRLARN